MIPLPFFLPLCFSVSVFFFFQKTLRDMITLFAASIRAKFEQFLWERFGNISERSFKGHKKETVKQRHSISYYAIDIIG